MSIQALRFTEGARPVQSQLTAGSSLAFVKSLSAEGPAAYVIRNQDLDALRCFDDVIVDRGNKHKAKALWDILGGQKKIPLVSGGYTQAGRLLQGVRDLLANADDHGERNSYIIGSDDAIFRQLWKKNDALPSGDGLALLHERVPPQGILNLLPPSEVPPELLKAFVGDSVEVRLVRQLILLAARQEEPVLILGDTGTGKEVVARCIHDCSTRRAEKFTSVNCGAIPRDLFESELFGHERGSFTHAISRKVGLWKVADNSTLFLDEIADLAPDHQGKILRALEENEILPVGAERPIPVNARVITATNRDLYGMVKAGEFREDLYYRLRGFCIPAPALQTHPQDIAALAQFLWQKITKQPAAVLPADIVTALASYRWPGNVRELRAVLSQLHAVVGDAPPRIEHLHIVCQLQGKVAVAVPTTTREQERSPQPFECVQHLRRVEEVIRTTEVTLRPFVRAKKGDTETVDALHRSLHYRLNELTLLCLHEPLFHNRATFAAVERLKAKLTEFDRLLQKELKEALSYWKNRVAHEFELALSAIFKEVERVMREV